MVGKLTRQRGDWWGLSGTVAEAMSSPRVKFQGCLSRYFVGVQLTYHQVAALRCRLHSPEVDSCRDYESPALTTELPPLTCTLTLDTVPDVKQCVKLWRRCSTSEATAGVFASTPAPTKGPNVSCRAASTLTENEQPNDMPPQ